MSVPCMYRVRTIALSIGGTYRHDGTDMFVHVYARWSGFQMLRLAIEL